MATVNIADERRTRELQDKFKIKGAHERDITPFTRILYVVLHVASAFGAIASLFYHSFDSKVQQFLTFILCGFVMGLNEYFKGKKMEDFTTLSIISTDPKIPMEQRELAHDNKGKAFFFVLLFWVVSICSVGFTGYCFGNAKTGSKFTAENYDETLRNAANTSVTAINNAIQQGNSPKVIAKLKAESQAAVLVWQTHKERVDSDNRRNKVSNEDEAVVMGLIYILLAILLECALFLARLWHEKEQYAVLQSRLERDKEAKKQPKTDSNSEVTAEKEKKTKETAKSDEVMIKQTDLNMIIAEMALLREQRNNLLIENAKK